MTVCRRSGGKENSNYISSHLSQHTTNPSCQVGNEQSSPADGNSLLQLEMKL